MRTANVTPCRQGLREGTPPAQSRRNDKGNHWTEGNRREQLLAWSTLQKSRSQPVMGSSRLSEMLAFLVE